VELLKCTGGNTKNENFFNFYCNLHDSDNAMLGSALSGS